MIETPEGIDRGRVLYEKYKKALTAFCADRKHTYFDSDVYDHLKNRVQTLDDVIDLRFKNNTFISEIAMPICNKRYRELGAFTRKYFENDPLVTFTAIEGTEQEAAKYRQLIVNKNFVTTKFRENCFHWLSDSIARYGTCVAFTQYVEGFGQTRKKLRYNPQALYSPYQREQVQQQRKSAVTYPIHVLNYFCDPGRNYFKYAQYEGFIDCWTVSQLIMCKNDPDNYIVENIDAVLNNIATKNGSGLQDEEWYGGNGLAEARDYSKATVNVSRMWAKLPFEGNEDDPTEYYIEFINDIIIRIQESELDIRPIKTGCLISRPDVWYGNTDIENVIPHQNTSNWLMNTQIESQMRLMDRILLVRKGSLDIPSLNSRHQTGGIVYYDGQFDDPAKLMYQVQARDNGLNGLDWINRELKQSIQESSPIVNMQNKYNEGGLNNSTLGAAQMMAGIGEVLQADMMKNFSYVLEHVAIVSGEILAEMLDDQITVQLGNGQYETIEKYQMLGDFEGKVETSMKMNQMIDFTNKSNKLTQILNWIGTGRPEFQEINLRKVLRDVMKSGIGEFDNIDEYYQQPSPQAGSAYPMLNAGQPVPAAPMAPQPQQTPMVGAQ